MLRKWGGNVRIINEKPLNQLKIGVLTAGWWNTALRSITLPYSCSTWTTNDCSSCCSPLVLVKHSFLTCFYRHLIGNYPFVNKQFSRPSSTTKCSIILYLIFFNKCPNFQQFHSVAVYHACLVHLPYTRIRRYRIDIGIGRWSKLQDRYRTDDGRTDEKVVSNHQLSWWTIKLSFVYTVFTCWAPLMQKIQSS